MNKKKKVFEADLTKMNSELDSFSVNLNKKHYDAALKVRGEIQQLGFGDVPMKVHASEIYKKSFTFPQIAHNDYAVEQFETLSIAEQNLATDVSNEQ